MTAGRRRAAVSYIRFVVSLVLIGAGFLFVGLLAARRFGGDDAVPALATGCAVSFGGSVAGSVPILVRSLRAGTAGPAALLASLLVRLTVVAVAAVLLIALGGAYDLRWFLLSLAASYLVFLLADVRYALANRQVR